MPQAQGQVTESVTKQSARGAYLVVTIGGVKYSCFKGHLHQYLPVGAMVTFEWSSKLSADGQRTYYNLEDIPGVVAQPQAGRQQVNPQAQAYSGPPPVVPPGPLPVPAPNKYGKSEKEQTHIMRENCQGVAATVIAAWLIPGERTLEEIGDMHIKYARRLEMEYVLGFGEGGSIPEPNWDDSPGTPEERGETG